MNANSFRDLWNPNMWICLFSMIHRWTHVFWQINLWTVFLGIDFYLILFFVFWFLWFTSERMHCSVWLLSIFVFEWFTSERMHSRKLTYELYFELITTINVRKAKQEIFNESKLLMMQDSRRRIFSRFEVHATTKKKKQKGHKHKKINAQAAFAYIARNLQSKYQYVPLN